MQCSGDSGQCPVQFSLSVMSDSLWPSGLEHSRLPCPSPTPGVCSNSCPLSWWCHPTISSSVVPLCPCLQSFPASGSFLRSQFFTSGDWSIGASALAPVLPMNIQGWLPLGLTGLSSWCPRDSQESSPALDNILTDKYTYRIYTILNRNTAQERKKNNDSVDNKKNEIQTSDILTDSFLKFCHDFLSCFKALTRKDAKGKEKRKDKPIWMQSSKE